MADKKPAKKKPAKKKAAAKKPAATEEVEAPEPPSSPKADTGGGRVVVPRHKFDQALDGVAPRGGRREINRLIQRDCVFLADGSVEISQSGAELLGVA